MLDKREPLSGNDDITKLSFGAELYWEFFIGFLAFFVVKIIYFSGDAEITVRDGQLHGTLAFWPQVISFSSGLAYFIVCNFLCTKNAHGKFELKPEHLWVRYIISILIGLMFMSLGWAVALGASMWPTLPVK